MKLTSHFPTRFNSNKPFQPGQEIQPAVYSKSFRYLSYALFLRPFCPGTDIPFVYHWAWNIPAASELIAASYHFTSECSFARSYMMSLQDGTPVGEIDLCNALQDELCDHYKTRPGDFVMRIMLPRKPSPAYLHENILLTSLEYFFSQPEIQRIVVEPETADRNCCRVLSRTGFHYQQKIYQSYKTANLYCCKRETFRRRFAL